jgi:hypothetical protein
MSMKRTGFRVLLVATVFVLAVAAAAPAQEKADTSKIVGTWTIDVYAGDETYILKLAVTVTDGGLAGKISESMGAFLDVAVSDISYDGDTFRFHFVSPTPPDGSSRTVNAEFRVGVDEMIGTITVPDIEATAEAKATRQAV